MSELWARIKASLARDLATPAARRAQDQHGDFAEFLTGSRRGGFGIGMDVIESPHLPPDTFIIGPAGGVRMWEYDEPFRISEPLWEPAPPAPLDWAAVMAGGDGKGLMPRDAYHREREAALNHLERLLDRTCNDLGLDPEVVWKGPRRDQTRRVFHRHQQVAFIAEARASFSILRPDQFVVVDIT